MFQVASPNSTINATFNDSVETLKTLDPFEEPFRPIIGAVVISSPELF